MTVCFLMSEDDDDSECPGAVITSLEDADEIRAGVTQGCHDALE